MTWYAAYAAKHGHHELIGALSVNDDAELMERKSTVLHGMERLLATAPIATNVAPLLSIQMHRVVIRLQEVWSEREVLFHYITVENPDNPVAWPPMDPRLNWFDATFVPLGAALMCERCPDRKAL